LGGKLTSKRFLFLDRQYKTARKGQAGENIEFLFEHNIDMQENKDIVGASEECADSLNSLLKFLESPSLQKSVLCSSIRM